MKCLTIRQPWARLIVNGYKPVENRTWETNLRGDVLIHAAKGMTQREFIEAYEFILQLALEKKKGFARSTRRALYDLPLAKTLDRGCIIGKVTLTDCVQRHSSPYFTGPYGRVFTNPHRCKPFPYTGQLGCFNVPDDIVQQLEWI